MRYACLLWDCNGTLTDDQTWAMRAVNDMLERRDREPLTKEQYYDYLDTPIRRFYEHVFDLTREDYDGILQEYNELYARYMKQYGALRPGVRKLLQQVHKTGAQQWVVTASRQQDVEQYLRRFGVLPYMDRVLGADNYHSESKVDRVCAAIDRAGIPAFQILVIGDTLHDLEMASALQADCALLSGGHQSPVILARHHACLCHSMDELRKVLEI